jgi:hypothetical protein
VQDRAGRVIMDNLGLTSEHKAHCSPEADSCQRFIRHVEQQYSSHRTSRWRWAVYLDLMIPVCPLVRVIATS